MSCRVYYNMQPCIVSEELKDEDHVNDCDSPQTPLPTCRLRKSSIYPPAVCRQTKPKVRTDYFRVMCVLCLSLGLLGTLCMGVYYIRSTLMSDKTDTVSHNSIQYSGDVITLSLHLQSPGVTNSNTPKNIIIPIDSLRSEDEQTLVCNMLLK